MGPRHNVAKTWTHPISTHTFLLPRKYHLSLIKTIWNSQDQFITRKKFSDWYSFWNFWRKEKVLLVTIRKVYDKSGLNSNTKFAPFATADSACLAWKGPNFYVPLPPTFSLYVLLSAVFWLRALLSYSIIVATKGHWTEGQARCWNWWCDSENWLTDGTKKTHQNVKTIFAPGRVENSAKTKSSLCMSIRKFSHEFFAWPAAAAIIYDW